eukprot:4912677-Prymnesium_polylepis.1
MSCPNPGLWCRARPLHAVVTRAARTIIIGLSPSDPLPLPLRQNGCPAQRRRGHGASAPLSCRCCRRRCGCALARRQPKLAKLAMLAKLAKLAMLAMLAKLAKLAMLAMLAPLPLLAAARSRHPRRALATAPAGLEPPCRAAASGRRPHSHPRRRSPPNGGGGSGERAVLHSVRSHRLLPASP